MIQSVMRKASRLFHVKVYEHAVCGNHLHVLVKGYDRESLQNFFRVFAGHTAQNILRDCPLPVANAKAGGAPPATARVGGRRKGGCRKNRRKFWSYLIYSRVVTWGREFRAVKNYIQRNTLEALHLIAYERKPRGRARFGQNLATIRLQENRGRNSS